MEIQMEVVELQGIAFEGRICSESLGTSLFTSPSALNRTSDTHSTVHCKHDLKVSFSFCLDLLTLQTFEDKLEAECANVVPSYLFSQLRELSSAPGTTMDAVDHLGHREPPWTPWTAVDTGKKP